MPAAVFSSNENLRSIQGEQQRVTQRAAFVVADQDDVEEYVAGASKGVLKCRYKGRHEFPDDLDGVLEFDGRTDDNLLYRKLRCKCCKLAIQVQYWSAVTMKTTNGKTRVRWLKEKSYVTYETGQSGERYVASPGLGRIFPSQVQSAVMTRAMGNTRTMQRMLKQLNKVPA